MEQLKLSDFENSLPGEQEAVDTLIQLLSAKMKKETQSSGKMNRDAHPKQIGLVKAEFSVDSNLPSELKVGLLLNKKRCRHGFGSQIRMHLRRLTM